MNNNSQNENMAVKTADNQKIEAAVKDDITLYYLNKEFALQCMSVPTYSREEYRLVTFIVLWARRNNIDYTFDDYGNIYLQKGELSDGEYFPCVTSHLDTVQDKQTPYIKTGVPLDLKIERTKDGKHKLSVDTNSSISIGIGADDKSGVCICLSIFQHVDKLKACFFLEEEVGCLGSNKMNLEWFNNVGYVIGFDSPDLHRAAWACSGTKLFSYKFYTKYMKDVCDRWGLTKGHFFSEPWTDVRNIRQQTDIICMNFGNGGYEAHQETEYCILEDMDAACGMGVDLIKNIGNTKHRLKDNSCSASHSLYKKTADGIYYEVQKDDTSMLEELGDNNRGYKSNFGYANTYNSSTSQVTSHKLNYIIARYENYIKNSQEKATNEIFQVLNTANVNKDDISRIISESFKTDITIQL